MKKEEREINIMKASWLLDATTAAAAARGWSCCTVGGGGESAASFMFAARFGGGGRCCSCGSALCCSWPERGVSGGGGVAVARQAWNIGIKYCLVWSSYTYT